MTVITEMFQECKFEQNEDIYGYKKGCDVLHNSAQKKHVQTPTHFIDFTSGCNAIKEISVMFCSLQC